MSDTPIPFPDWFESLEAGALDDASKIAVAVEGLEATDVDGALGELVERTGVVEAAVEATDDTVAGLVTDPESATGAALAGQFVLLAEADRVDGEVPVWDADAGEWVSGPGGGEQGPPGAGVPDGGTTGQVLAKKSESNQDTEWVDQSGGGGEMSAADILTALKTVDGSGSGLDADLLDGQSSAAFAAASHDHSGTYQPLDSDLTALAAAGNSEVLSATTASFLTADETKLDGIEALADVTDAANVSAAGASMISSGTGAPGTTPAKIGNIYIDTAADTLYYASGTASSADWELVSAGGGTTEAVAVYSSGWPSRPTADLVFWVANGDTAATTPDAATGDDIVILAQDADLTAIAALTSAADKVPYSTGTATWAMADFTAAGRTLVAGADDAAQRSSLGLGSIATQASSSVTITGGSVTGITDLAVADGGTGASTALAAVQNLRTAPATVSGASDTLAGTDDDTVILYTNSGLVTVTLANIATGFEAVLVSLGAAGLTVADGGMSFANSFTPKLTVAQGESLYVKQTAASTWIVIGGTAT